MAGMKRSPLVRKDPDTARLTIKPKSCKVCRAKFLPVRPMQIACGPLCAYAYAGKIAEGKAKQERKEDKAKREALKTIPQLIAEAQSAFNLYVRLRDNGRGCISCGRPCSLGGVGGGFDCGHLRSRGAASHLRFELDNAFGQCKQCNRHLAGNAFEMRRGAIERIGAARVEAIEADNTPRKWTREGLRAIKAEFQAKAAELRKAQDAA
jgi:hypothetical protein